jgi:hypothetical protein
MQDPWLDLPANHADFHLLERSDYRRSRPFVQARYDKPSRSFRFTPGTPYLGSFRIPEGTIPDSPACQYQYGASGNHDNNSALRIVVQLPTSKVQRPHFGPLSLVGKPLKSDGLAFVAEFLLIPTAGQAVGGAGSARSTAVTYKHQAGSDWPAAFMSVELRRMLSRRDQEYWETIHSSLGTGRTRTKASRRGATKSPRKPSTKPDSTKRLGQKSCSRPGLSGHASMDFSFTRSCVGMPYSTLPRRWNRNGAVKLRERGAFKISVPTRERGNKSNVDGCRRSGGRCP